MSKIKMVAMGLLFLIPAMVAAALLVLGLASIDYKQDPGTEVGTTLWGVWALCCGIYFKSKRFYWAAAALLGFAVLGLIVKAT